jgi:hypothetical protein
MSGIILLNKNEINFLYLSKGSGKGEFYKRRKLIDDSA